MRSFVLTSVLLCGVAFAGAQTIPPAQQSPSQVPGEPGTPPTFPRTPRTQIPPDQTLPTAQSPDENAQQPTAEQQNNPIAANTPLTIEGCLSGSSGNFTLTDESRGMFQLTGADKQLAAEVGHTVRVTGMPLNTSGVANEPGVSAKPEQEESQATAESNNPSQGEQTLNVSTVKVISNSCNDVPQR